MTTQQIADTLAALCSQGKFHEAIDSLYSPEIVSMEAGAPPGMSRESKGFAAVKAKSDSTMARPLVASQRRMKTGLSWGMLRSAAGECRPKPIWCVTARA